MSFDHYINHTSINRKTTVKCHLQIHEVIPTTPLNALRLQLLVDAGEVGSDIADGLLDLVVLAGSVSECFD